MNNMIQGLVCFGSTLTLVYVARQINFKVKRKNRTT